FEKLESPVLTNVEVRFDDPAAEVWPQRVPDLYVGEPIVVAVKFAKGGGRVIASGRLGTEEWHDVIPLPATAAMTNTSDDSVGKLWARMKIEALGDETAADQQAAIVELALAHHL